MKSYHRMIFVSTGTILLLYLCIIGFWLITFFRIVGYKNDSRLIIATTSKWNLLNLRSNTLLSAQVNHAQIAQEWKRSYEEFTAHFTQLVQSAHLQPLGTEVQEKLTQTQNLWNDYMNVQIQKAEEELDVLLDEDILSAIKTGDNIFKILYDWDYGQYSESQRLRLSFFSETLQRLEKSREQFNQILNELVGLVEIKIEEHIKQTIILSIIVSGVVIIISVVFSFMFSRQAKAYEVAVVNLVNRVSAGDFSETVESPQKRRFPWIFQRKKSVQAVGIVENALQNMQARIQAVLNEIDRLTNAIQAGQLDLRGNTETFSGSWRELMVGVNNVITAFLTPFDVTAEYINRIAKGDIPAKITEEYQGDFNEIKNNLNMLIDSMTDTIRLAEEISGGNLMVDVRERSEHDRLMKALNRMIRRLNAIVQGLDDLVHAVQNGELDTRGKTEPFEGVWCDLVISVNSLIDAFVHPITMTAEHLDRIARGNIPRPITEEYNGDFNAIKNNLNTLIETMNGLLQETNGLILAVQDGKLDTRGNAEAFEGGWRDLMAGMNNVIEAFVVPITMAANQIDRIAKGDIPEKITEEYNGDFNRLC